MLQLLLGPDDFTKTEYIQGLAKTQKAELAVFVQPEVLPLDQLGGQDLFGSKKIFVLKDAIKLLDEKNIAALTQSPNVVIVVEEKIDKRTTFNKELLKRKDVTVKEFPLPHGKELNIWISERIKILGGSIQPQALEALAVAVGRDDGKETKFGGKVVDVQEIFTLTSVNNEIQKLLAYADGAVITAEMVTGLVPENRQADVLEIINAIGENKRNEAMAGLQLFLQSENNTEEKGKIIQLNALLSEQFRNVSMVQNFLERRVSDGEILEKTQWKSGRLFIMKKIAGKFLQKNVLDVLKKLEYLDEELKSTSTPPRVLLDLIVVQLLK